MKVCEYIVPSVDSSKDAVVYEIYKGSFSSPGMKAYHARLQFFLLFFIDRSSFINDSDLLWEVLLLMERRVARHSSAVSYAVVGYTTLYKFLSYPSDWRLRLSSDPHPAPLPALRARRQAAAVRLRGGGAAALQ